MNPLAFEFQSSYLAFIASEVHSNRFFEFIQSQEQNEDAQSLPTVFGSDFRKPHYNLAYVNEKQITYSQKYVTYWNEYFGRFTK